MLTSANSAKLNLNLPLCRIECSVLLEMVPQSRDYHQLHLQNDQAKPTSAAWGSWPLQSGRLIQNMSNPQHSNVQTQSKFPGGRPPRAENNQHGSVRFSDGFLFLEGNSWTEFWSTIRCHDHLNFRALSLRNRSTLEEAWQLGREWMQTAGDGLSFGWTSVIRRAVSPGKSSDWKISPTRIRRSFKCASRQPSSFMAPCMAG